MNMLIVPLISLLGVILSVILSFIISKYQNKIELIKIHSMFIEQLYSKRLEAYLEIFELVSGFIKAVKKKDILYKELEMFYDEYTKLDSKYSLLFSHTTASSAQLIKEISNILDNNKEFVFSEDKKLILLSCLRDVETSLKIEIGVYVYKDPTTIVKKIDLPERKKETLARLEFYKEKREKEENTK